MELRTRIPGTLYRRASQWAADHETDLSTVIRRLLDLVVAGSINPLADDPIGTAIGRRGGQASANALSEDERSEKARKAALARWATP